MITAEDLKGIRNVAAGMPGGTPARASASVGALPKDSYNQMRLLDGNVAELERLVHVYVTRQTFLDHFDEWVQNWKKFKAGHESLTDRLWDLASTRALELQVEEYRQALEGWRAAYSVERDEKGNPLPAPITNVPGPGPGAPGTEEKKDEGWPTWVWALLALGGVGIGVGIYFAVRNAVRDTKAKAHALESALPNLLSSAGVPGGHAIGEAAGAHAPVAMDPLDVGGGDGASGCRTCGSARPAWMSRPFLNEYPDSR